MKVTTDGCLFGAWCADRIQNALYGKTARVLDIGAGTGLLCLMVAQKTAAFIETVEIDTAASEQAAENVTASPWQKRISVIHADVLAWQPSTDFDFILSNPPFYESDLKSDNPMKNLAHHDEGLRLEGLLAFIKKHLKPNGLFLLLLPAKRMGEAEKLIEETGLSLHEKVFTKQTPKHLPFRVMLAGGKSKTKIVKELTTTIKNEESIYTPEFTTLLREYYLYL